MGIFGKLFGIFKPKSYKIQTFTFYIPSPPERKSGYREKQFDKLFYNFINKGYEIISFNTQTNHNPGHSGMWIIALVRATNPESEKLNFEDFLPPELKPHDHPDKKSDVEGLYQID